MARVLLVGSGPLPHVDPDQLGFPQLRTHHALSALLRAGHQVRLVLLQSEGHGLKEFAIPGYPRPFEQAAVDPEHAGALEQIRALREDQAPDAVVSAAPYEPARFAALAVGEEPLWVDVPGDPFAEAQAKSAHTGESAATAHMRAAYAPAYARADAFGVISPAQRHALIGQLGWLGRLSTAPPDHEWVRSVPAAFDFGPLKPKAPRARREGSPLVVALAGGYNTWLDADTLLAGLLKAMRRLPNLKVISTGGGIPGHHTSTYDAFRTQALASPFADRFTFHGWVPHSVLPGLMSRAHVGICLDRPGYEAELGTRTRVLFFLHQGLDVLATPRSDLTRELAGLRMIVTARPGDSEALARALADMHRAGSDGDRAMRAGGYLRSRYALQPAMKPLLDWVASPKRVAPAASEASDLAAELVRLRQELAAVHSSPTWRVTGAADRFLRRNTRQLRKLLGREDMPDS